MKYFILKAGEKKINAKLLSIGLHKCRCLIMDNAHNFRELKGMLKTTGKIRTVCMQGDNCKRRLKNGDHNHEDKESRDLGGIEERKKREERKLSVWN